MNIVFRADASTAIGTGHFIRCLSLADGIRERGAICFASRNLPVHLRRLIAARNYELVSLDYSSRNEPDDVEVVNDGAQAADAAAAILALSPRTWDWVVVDHYALGARWEEAMRGVARRILVIDDLANRRHACDLLLDQNLYADLDSRYAGKVPVDCRLLLGPRYALLREDFRRLRGRLAPRSGAVRRILVFFGGADATNVTSLAIRALANCRLKDVGVDVVVGAGHPHRTQVEGMCHEEGFTCHVETPRMAELMAEADFAIGAGGSATWERCCLGVPALAFPVAGNQRRLLEDAALRGLVYTPTSAPITITSIERHVNALMDNPRLLQLISRNAWDAVDGLGVDRVARVLEGDPILIREATMEDAQALFTWRNDESVRVTSRDARPIDWAEHHAWLASVTADPRRALVIGECGGAPVGVVRFDMSDIAAEVSIYKVPGAIGAGLGGRLLMAAESWLVARHGDIVSIRAEVLEDNQPSHRLFRSMGYRPHSTLYIKRIGAS